MGCAAILLNLIVVLAPPASDPLPDATPVHVGLSLAVTHTAELDALRRAQQDPASPEFRRWITPAEYGARFGQPAATYAAVSSWLRANGFTVTEHPNRTFIEGLGTASGVAKLLSIHLRHIAGAARGVHAPDRQPRFPSDIATILVHVSGLDTRVSHHHHLVESGGSPSAMGPQDIRRFYDLAPLLDGGYVGQRQELVVLGEAEPPASVVSPQAIDYYLSNVSDVRAPLIFDNLPNPQEDVDPGGGNQEFQPDVELQSIGVPGAASLTFVASPASEVFTTGANEIVSNLSSATAVSVSLGICEQEEDPNEATAFRNYVIQGTMEGQTWSAATGDFGSDDCGDGQTVAVDFPASVPEVVAMGGSEVQSASFDSNDAITGYQPEVVWSNIAEDAAGGGGLSTLFATPSYQSGLGVSMRSVPDVVLLAGDPGVAADSSNPFIQLPLAGQLTQFEGTSAASPLSAGFFALIASRLGCRLGDPHAALYAMGNAQFDGGPAVFHDITQGTVALDGVPGPSATVGYDSASGWGSLDVAALAAAWPPCPAVDAGYGFDGGIAPEKSYSQCAFIDCDGGQDCVTLPEGPSSCETPCSATSACGTDSLCTAGTIFADAGLCVPGCATDADCAGQAGTVCNACEEACVPPGTPNAGVGIPCEGPSDCMTSGLCLLEDMAGNQWPGGYCTTFCDPTGALTACGCPSGTICSPTMAICLEPCGPLHHCRAGYACQPDGDGTSSCQLPCQVITQGGQSFDTCSMSATPTLACDVNTGVCGGTGTTIEDAGTDAGVEMDAGTDAGVAASPDAGTVATKSGGCGCAGSSPSDAALLLGAMLALWKSRRRS